MKKVIHLLGISFFSLLLMHCQGPSATHIRPNALFTDNAVLQRGKDIIVWGTADPGGTVEVELGDNEQQAEVNEQGKWQVTLPAMEAGGPYELEIEGAEEISLKNIMLGDVWLASGQSNMEWALKTDVDNFEEEIANADFPNIRLFTVERNTSDVPLDSMSVVAGGWLPCSPETVPDFSAVAYFFGRKIHQEQGVPIGLISSNWGGTPAEAWTSESALMTMPDFKPVLEKRQQARKSTGSEEQKTSADIIQSANQKISASDYQPSFDVSQWKTMAVPALWEEADTTLRDFDGFVWFRKTINIPSRYTKQALSLHLGAVDDNDIVWLNGQRIGETEGYNKDRVYELPTEAVKAGENTITIRVQDNSGGGGLYGPAEKMYLAQGDNKLKVELTGPWRYDATQEPRFPPASRLQHEPAMLYNAMIAPLLPYPIKGVIWYQGESNAGRPQQYATLFPTMIKDWRQQWGGDNFPFLYVQLANFMPNGAPSDQWAYQREAQNKALELENTGVAVTIDIGDSTDIHPRNKQDVGDRLATAAQGVAYGDQSVFTGPMYESMRASGDSIVVTFKGTGEGLMKLADEEANGFMIAGEDRQFVKAVAHIVGPNEISVWSSEVEKPVAVRYGWANNPTVNMYSEDGLPLSPFRTDDWEKADENSPS